jgi:2-polyprenyl-6-methoxyphenol hydroxylase-like FAD-dependent oxidoreductase
VQHREQSRDVMVLGATPVGSYIASQLARQGVSVNLLDDRFDVGEPRRGATVLYPDTLERLRAAGLTASALGASLPLRSVTVYEDQERKAVLPLGADAERLPRVVSRAGLDAALRRGLSDQHLDVAIRRRVVGLRPAPDGVDLRVGKIDRELTGYAVMGVEEVIRTTEDAHASWVVGADGEDSTIRSRIDVELEATGERALFVTLEFGSAGPIADDEMRVLFAGALTGTAIPTPEGGHRWRFCIPDSEGFREKLRARPEPTVRHLVELLASRLPYLTLDADDLVFADVAHRTPGVAAALGRGHVLLAGEAAHQVDPLGDRDLNEGLSAADLLVSRITEAILGAPTAESLAYEAEVRQLLAPVVSVTRSFDATRANDPWIAQHFGQLAPMLPVEGADLERLSEGLGVPRHRLS